MNHATTSGDGGPWPQVGVTAVMLPELTFEEQVDLCVAQGVRHYVYRPRVVGAGQRGEPWSNWGAHKFDLTPQGLVERGAELAGRLRDAGIEPFCTVPRGTETVDEKGFSLDLAGAAAGGAGRVRVLPLSYPRDGLFAYEAYFEKARAWLERQIEMAGDYGIKIVIEMHAGTSACSPGLAARLVHGLEPARVGLVYDLPNFAKEGFVNPWLSVSVGRAYLDHVHVGGARRMPATGPDDGGWNHSGITFCGLNDSDLDIRQWVAALARAKEDLVWVVEDYTPGLTGAERLVDTAAWLRLAYADAASQG